MHFYDLGLFLKVHNDFAKVQVTSVALNEGRASNPSNRITSFSALKLVSSSRRGKSKKEDF